MCVYIYKHIHSHHTGVVEEAAEFVKALTIDKTLQAAFIAELQKPGDRLLKLSEEVRLTIHIHTRGSS